MQVIHGRSLMVKQQTPNLLDEGSTPSGHAMFSKYSYNGRWYQLQRCSCLPGLREELRFIYHLYCFKCDRRFHRIESHHCPDEISQVRKVSHPPRLQEVLKRFNKLAQIWGL